MELRIMGVACGEKQSLGEELHALFQVKTAV